MVQDTTQMLYQSMIDAEIEVLWDDRDERAGVKFNDADLIGAPFQVTIGDKGIKNGVIEIKHRRSGEVEKVAPTEATSYLAKQLASLRI